MQGDCCLCLPSAFPELQKGTEKNASMQCLHSKSKDPRNHAAQHPHLKDQETEILTGEDQAKVERVTEHNVLTPNHVLSPPCHTASAGWGDVGKELGKGDAFSSHPHALTDFHLHRMV